MKRVLICMLQLHKASGSARTAYEDIEYFKSLNFEVHVAAMTMDKNMVKELGGIPHKMLPWIKSTGLMRRRWFNYQVERLKRKIRPDMVIGHGDILEQDILTLHNSVFLASELINGKKLDPKNEMAQLHGEILNKKKFKLVVANSHLMKEDLIQRFHIPEDQVKVVYPSLDTKLFNTKSNKTKTELKKIFGFSDKVTVALVTSGNFKKRGLDIFIEAIKLLPKDIQDRAEFRVVGKDSPFISDDVPIKYDPIISNIQDYYKAIDVCVLPARIEEFGRVVAEAMASGLPVITTNKVGASEILEGKSKRFIIKPGSQYELKTALEELIVSSTLREEIGSLNARSVLKVSKEKLFRRFEDVFMKVS